MQLHCEYSPSTHTKLLLFNPCTSIWYLDTEHAGVAIKFEICIPEAEMSETLEVLVAYRWKLTAESSPKLSENFSSLHSHWMQRRRIKWRDAYKHFVTSTVHVSCNSHTRNKTQLDMNIWKILHVLIPKTWYNTKWLWLVCWPHCIKTNVPIFTIVSILYTNWLCTQYTTLAI